MFGLQPGQGRPRAGKSLWRRVRARRRDGDLTSRRVHKADRGSRSVQIVIQRPPSPFMALGLVTEISSVSAQQVVHREPSRSLLLDEAGPE